MGVQVLPSTIAGGFTPTCNACGVALCWDISEEEYDEARAFWNAWICEHCNGGVRLSLKAWLTALRATIDTALAKEPR